MAFPLPAAFGVAALLTGGWVALSLYTQPASVREPVTAVRHYLEAALRHDTAYLAEHATSVEPAQWALSAAEQDSAALRTWLSLTRRPVVHRRGDTTWVYFKRMFSPANCPVVTSLVAGLVEDGGEQRVMVVKEGCFEGRG